MTPSRDLIVDVTKAAGLGEPASIALNVHLPDAGSLPDEPTVCFAKPGGGYSKGYYTEALPGPGRGAQAEWHRSRGWVFVSLDHLGVGASSTEHAPERLDYPTLAAANQAAEQEVLRRLADGEITDGYPAVRDPLRLGIGQSMGGCMTVVQQAIHASYDGIGVLGYSAVHTHPPARPGRPAIPAPWLARDTLAREEPTLVNAAQLIAAATAAAPAADEDEPPMGWGFFYDDVDPGLVRTDLADFPTRNGVVPPWGSGTLPGAVASSCLTPGVIATEAAAVTAPVLVALGERDVCADPRGEPRAYRSAISVDLFVCPRMGHMHNFAGTRELFWRRIETWAEWVREVRSSSDAC
jgi:pimeloyl-ACP methyl ester carboxylesterase